MATRSHRLVATVCCLLGISGVGSPVLADLTPVSPQFRVDADGDFGDTNYSRSVTRFADGSFIVVWRKPTFPQGVLGQRYDAQGAKLGTAFTIAPAPLGTYQYNFAVAGHTDKSFVVVWGVVDSTSVRAAGQRLDASGALVGTEFAASTGTADQIRSTDVAVLPGGGFVVVWDTTVFGYNSTDGEVFGQRFDGSATKVGTEFQVNQFTTGYQKKPRVASATDGRFVVVWESGDAYFGGVSPDGNYQAIAARSFNASGTPATSEFVVNTFTTYSENSPDVAMAAGGGFVVVWSTPYGDDAPGGGLGDRSVTMRRFGASGAPLDDEVHINAYISGDQGRPKISMDNDGSFVVVWESSSNYYFTDGRDGDGRGVFGRCFSSGGAPVGGDFMVNTYTTGDQQHAGLSSDGAGNFVVAWTGAYKDTGGGFGQVAGVAARLFRRAGSAGLAFTIEKTDNGNGWTNAPLTYDITVNSFGEPSNNVVVTEIVPEKTVFQPGLSSAGWVCSPDTTAGSVCTLDLGDLAQDESRTVTFVVTVVAGTSLEWELFNDAVADRDAVGGGREFTCNGPAEDVTPSGLSLQACVVDPTGCFNLFCRALPADPLCTALGGTAPLEASIIASVPRIVTCPPGGPTPSPLGVALLKARDRMLDENRGGKRLIDLGIIHADDLRTAADNDPSLVTLLGTGLAAPGFADDVRAYANGDPVSGTLTQLDVNLDNGFLDALEAAAPPALLAALQRERARLDIDGWVGKTIDEVVADLNQLTCEGFETALFCGELTGDCVITATDALIVLQIGVGSKPSRGEADLDGNGTIVATDALRTLLIAVGANPPTTACNVP